MIGRNMEKCKDLLTTMARGFRKYHLLHVVSSECPTLFTPPTLAGLAHSLVMFPSLSHDKEGRLTKIQVYEIVN